MIINAALTSATAILLVMTEAGFRAPSLFFSDLTRSRTHSQGVAEPLIPEIPTYVVVRRPAFGIDEEIVRLFQMMEDMLGQF